VNSLNNKFPILIYEVSLNKVEVHISYYDSRDIQTDSERERQKLSGPLNFLKPKIPTPGTNFWTTPNFQETL
jgi:hypothetical protein